MYVPYTNMYDVPYTLTGLFKTTKDRQGKKTKGANKQTNKEKHER